VPANQLSIFSRVRQFSITMGLNVVSLTRKQIISSASVQLCTLEGGGGGEPQFLNEFCDGFQLSLFLEDSANQFIQFRKILQFNSNS
jgi:hypothetical protein